ncbi:MAG TPA: ABC transporter ATP-binding protein [Candidatus Saccharimonadales bacterium]|nr:ABC transporter ATP-binding protein [Candidatus Saccharimonadales bacterium]
MQAATSPTSAAIALTRLSKQYRGTTEYALRNVSLAVASGEVYGFLGPNGAGKSTTIRCLLNFIQPTSGSATILGNDIVRSSVAAKQYLGYLAGDVALYRSMTGQDFLQYMAALQPLKHPGYIRTLTRDFRAELNKPLATLSKGNRQKIGLLQAMMHEPEVLILDEPTSGLDPLMQEVFFAHIGEAKARGAAIFFSSHNLPEVRRTCDRIGFIKDGQLVAEQSIADLAALASHTFEITFAGPAPLAELKRLKHVVVTPTLEPERIAVAVHGELSPFLRTIAKHTVLQLDQRAVDLEDQFMHFYQKGPAK